MTQPTTRPTSKATAERILKAAEKLFMQFGFDATSMRQITAEAGVNLASVNYHFGSKEGLMQEIFRRKLGELNTQRLKALDELERYANGKPLAPRLILDAFFGTLLRQAKDDPRNGRIFLKLLGRTVTEPAEYIRSFLADEYRIVLNRYQKALCLALPGIPKTEIAWRFHFMVGATAYAIGGTDSLRLITASASGDDSYEYPHDIDRFNQRLINFLSGGLNAPPP